MIHVMVIAWALCFVFSLIVIGVYLYILQKQFLSIKFRVLNENLQKIDLFWSNSNSDFKSLGDGLIKADQTSLYRSVVLTGAIFSFLSVVGFLLLVVIFVSARYLARPRLEQAVFKSELVKNKDLSAEQVKTLVTELRLIH